jgi:hypothetical protein
MGPVHYAGVARPARRVTNAELPRSAAGEGGARGLLLSPIADWPSPLNTGNDVPVREKSSDQDPLAELLRANLQPRPRPVSDLVPYDYYFSHPEWRPRKLTRRRLRRRIIREG